VSAGAPALALRDLRVVRGGRQVLRVEALDVAPGEVVAVIGPNGSGKSTLLLSSALLLPAEGELRLFGQEARWGNAVALRRRTATVFQDSALLDMSARANVETALALHGVPRGERRTAAEEWLRRLGVSHRAEARAHQLSGGEAQRVSLARAFAVRPELLFLDEAFSALDSQTRGALLGDVRALLEAEGTTALLTTHDRAEAELLADRAVVLIDGAVAQDGPIEEVVARPATSDVARFLGHSVAPAGVVARLIGVERDDEGEAAIPPSAVRLAEEGVAGSVLSIRGAPEGAEVVVNAGAPVALRIPVSELRARALQAGDEVMIEVDPSQVTWL
jgi:tungstate transport system ATP-binding protein